MIHSGLCSVTFRGLEPGKIVTLAVQAQLKGIEWGGDVHVPHGDMAKAKEVRRMTEDAGLEVAAYGSYYRLAKSEEEGLTFDTVLETAVALGAPGIRVWAGSQGSAKADEAYRDLVAREAKRIAEMAAADALTVSFEFHGNTLTDTGESARGLLERCSVPNLYTYWQTPLDQTFESRLESLGMILSWLSNLHVFWIEKNERLSHRPLRHGEVQWRQYLRKAGSMERERYALLEFVKDGSEEQFLEDAGTLHCWLVEMPEEA